VLRDVAELEILQAPGLPYIVPRALSEYTYLTGAPPPPLPFASDEHLAPPMLADTKPYSSSTFEPTTSELQWAATLKVAGPRQRRVRCGVDGSRHAA